MSTSRPNPRHGLPLSVSAFLMSVALTIGLGPSILSAQSTGAALPAPGGPQLTGNGEAADAQVPDVLIPPAPAPSPDDNGTPESPSADPAPATDSLAAARSLLAAGRYDQAIESASNILAADPDNTEARQLRADAYAGSGRYAEALADRRPLEVVVASPQAALMSGSDLVARVPAGTRLQIIAVKNAWLQVAADENREYAWAWINRADLIGNVPTIPPQPLEAGGVIRFESPYVRARSRNYGRDYYDWWQHVPGPYRGFLPR